MAVLAAARALKMWNFYTTMQADHSCCYIYCQIEPVKH